ncbi:MAG: hypothetical protein JWO67_6654 [Streptosporangiaceae bacterium]|jgi:hypothetical protein|nr:hypothetical protein [Streptosporangiaceae bacterium]
MIVIVGSVALLGALVTGPVSPPPEASGVQPCPQACAMIYEPVTCRFEDGTARAFGNRCTADAYACSHNARIAGCGAKRR